MTKLSFSGMDLYLSQLFITTLKSVGTRQLLRQSEPFPALFLGAMSADGSDVMTNGDSNSSDMKSIVNGAGMEQDSRSPTAVYIVQGQQSGKKRKRSQNNLSTSQDGEYVLQRDRAGCCDAERFAEGFHQGVQKTLTSKA